MSVFKRLGLIATLVLLSGCANLDVVTINGTSIHLSAPHKNRDNHGLGVRLDSGYELGFYRNSRTKVSYSPYITKRVWQRGVYFADIGAAYYPAYNDKAGFPKPILKAGRKIPITPRLHVEFNIAPTDLLMLQMVYDL